MSATTALLSDAEIERPKGFSLWGDREILADRDVTVWRLTPDLANFTGSVRRIEGLVQQAATEDMRTKLLELLKSNDLAEVSLALSGIEPAQGSSTSAAAVISNLPNGALMPKLAVDEDGDILLTWDGEATTVITVEECELHILVKSADGVTVRFDSIDYGGQELPIEVTENIPLGR